jgi:hypothetical protein
MVDHVQQTLLPGMIGGTPSAVTTDIPTGDSLATVGNMHIQWTPCTWNGTVCTAAARNSGSTLHVELKYDVSNLLFLPTTFRFGSLVTTLPTMLPPYRVTIMAE